MTEIIKGTEPNDGRTQDALWQKQQIKSFTAWVNTHFNKPDEITDIATAFNDGTKLMKLVERISGDKLPPPEKGKMKLHKIQNINKALDHIAAKGVKLAGISSEEIYDCNLKMILGMVWVLILNFQINDISVEEMSARDGLLLWCQKKTAGYSGCNVQNFHTSWQDGRAFCALIHRHRPDLLDYNNLPSNSKDRLNLAFKVAEEDLGIPQMLDAEDMVNSSRPDERSVMTYVSAYYHCFAGSNRAEVASRRIENVLSFQKQVVDMIEEYETRCSSLLKWIAEKHELLSGVDPFSTMGAFKVSFQEFNNFKTNEKPEKAEEKIGLEAHYSNLQTMLRINNRPAYHPEEGKLVSDIQKAWNDLSIVEKNRNTFLHKEKDRLEKLERLARKFKTKSSIHSKWASGKIEHVQSTSVGHDVGSVVELIKQLDAVLSDIDAHSARVTNLGEIVNELEAADYEKVEDIKETYGKIQEDWSELNEAGSRRKKQLEEELLKQQRLDELRLNFAKLAASISSWTEATSEELMEDITTSSMDDVAQEEAAFEEIQRDISNKKSNFDEIAAVSKQMEEAGITSNQYTPHTRESIQTMWQEIKDAVAARREKLTQEKSRQEDCESLRLQFAEPANKLGKRMEDISSRISVLPTGSLEEQLSAANVYAEEVAECKPELDVCNELDKRLQDANIFQNAYAMYSTSELVQKYDKLASAVRRNITTIQNQILMRDKSGISEEQMKEYKEAFNHFDHDKSGRLGKNDFRSAILAVGYDLGEGDAKFEQLWQDNGEKDGGVSFESFTDIISREQKDEGSMAQLVESFRTLAGDKDYITEAELRRDLKKELADFALTKLKPYPGVQDGYDYKSFSEGIFN